MRLAVVLCVLPALAQAQAFVSAVLDATGVPDARLERLQRATEAALKQVTGLSVGQGPAFKRDGPRRCEDCARELVASLSSAGAVLLDVKGLDAKGERVSVEVQVWLDGERLGSKRGEGTVDGFEAAVRPALEALLPAWARRGFGGLRLEFEPGTVVKVDGRLTSPKADEVLPVPAGPHLVDVVFPEGHALLQRVEVAEGSRVRVEARVSEAFSGAPARPAGSPLQVASYVSWMTGTAALAGGLVLGGLGRGTEKGLTPCAGDFRDCATLDEVLQRQAQSQTYADVGNVLLGVGTGLAVTGVVLFIIDAVRD
jgi:hypothetical protein